MFQSNPLIHGSLTLILIALFVPEPTFAQGDRSSGFTAEAQPTTQPTQQDTEAASLQPAAKNVTPSIADVDAKIAEVAAATGLEETVAASTNELLQQAKLNLQAAEEFKAQATASTTGFESSTEKLKAVKKELDQKSAPVTLPQNSTLPEVKLQYESVEAELKSTREKLVNQSGEASRRQSRLLEIPNLQTEAEEKSKQVDTQLTQVMGSEDSKLVVDARRMNLLSQKYKLRQEIASLDAERKFYAATSELLPLQTEALQRKVESLETKTAKLKVLVEAKRGNEIDRLASAVKDRLDKTSASIAPEAEVNVELVQQYGTNSDQLAKVGTEFEMTQKSLDDITSDYKTSVERVDAIGLNATLGMMFRRNKSELAVKRRSFQSDGSLQNEIQNLQLEMFSLQDLSKHASETEASISLIFQKNNVPETERKDLREEVVGILSQRREILSQLMQTKTDLFNRLVALDVDKRKTVNQIDAYTDYINEHVLWIRSADTIGRSDVISLG